MTRISKILAVFLAVGSLAFAGFAIATTFGGPDWQALLDDPMFNGYKIARTGGEKPLWEATRASDEEKIGSSRRLPEVIVKVMDDILKRQSERTQQLGAEEQALRSRIQLLELSLAADIEALKAFDQAQRQRIADLRKQGDDVAARAISATADAQKLENIIATRREDILRLRQQVEELQTDSFRLEQIRKQLANELIQMQGLVNRAQARQRQLDSDV